MPQGRTLVVESHTREGHSMFLPSSAHLSPSYTPTLCRCMRRPDARQAPTPGAVIGWPCLRDVFGAPSTTVIGEPALPKPAKIPAKHLGGVTAGKGDPMVHAQSGQVGLAKGACNTAEVKAVSRGKQNCWAVEVGKNGAACRIQSLPPDFAQCTQGHGGPRYPTPQQGKTPKVVNLSRLRIRIRKRIRMYSS